MSRRLLLGAIIGIGLVLGCAAPSATAPTSAPAAPTTAPAASPKPAGAPSSSASPSASPVPAASPAAAPSVVASPVTGAPAGPAANVSMGYSNITGDEIAVYYALDAGVFTRHNLNVSAQLISGGANTTAALLAGQIQVAGAGGSETLSAAANGANLVVVATISGVYPYLFEVAADIKSFADLKGKKLGVSNIGGSADIALRVVLRQNGINPETDVTIVATGSAQNRTAAMQSGAIQGGMAAPPENLAVEAAGMHPLVDLATQRLPAANTSIVMQQSFVQSNHDVVQRFVDALVESSVQLKKDKPGAVTILKKYFNSNEDEAMSMAYEYFANEVVQTLPFPRPEQFKDATETLSVTNPRVRDVDLSKLLDPSFVQNAADRGLGK